MKEASIRLLEKQAPLPPKHSWLLKPLLILCPPNIHDCWPLLAVKPHLSFNLGLEVRVCDWDLCRHVPASLDKLTGMSWQSPLWAITLHSPLPPLMLGWGTDLTEGRYPQVKNCFKLTLHRLHRLAKWRYHFEWLGCSLKCIINLTILLTCFFVHYLLDYELPNPIFWMDHLSDSTQWNNVICWHQF